MHVPTKLLVSPFLYILGFLIWYKKLLRLGFIWYQDCYSRAIGCLNVNDYVGKTP